MSSLRSLCRATGPLLAVAFLTLTTPALSGDFLAQAHTPAATPAAPLAQRLTRLAPQADPEVLRLAARALSCADPDAERLAVIDFSQPSTEKRLWVFDLARNRLLFHELVSHGQGSGNAMAREFSNTPDSHQSSLGLFRTMNSYHGRNGYSLRLEGLEPGVNDLAFERAIVMHGADYVSQSFIERTGRLGRSHGCPAVRSEVAVPLIDSLKDSQYLFTYYPDPEWLASSEFLSCPRGDQRLAMQ
ncbi:murein L,D-transpeptidase catalytic domain family protein [Halomonas beimenensis]|uniref:Lipoprotein-anchoring transpeptidase ErfK/SrfK n=1 Tax=Halomonas beimenensis TaxID=475662 RepID=A0A291P9U4_9GAMM|nr:murein L,D-transpeptidase catalytic domain family protein [Halomonas beimenensis]ATJ83639.1 lipoprotein-anchoring transpeptidase ErfK/SrfK [Halomonas beimenensis]